MPTNNLKLCILDLLPAPLVGLHQLQALQAAAARGHLPRGLPGMMRMPLLRPMMPPAAGRPLFGVPFGPDLIRKPLPAGDMAPTGLPQGYTANVTCINGKYS